MDDNSLKKDSGIRQPNHEYDQHPGPSHGQSHHDRSVEMLEWSESNLLHGPDQPLGEKGPVKDRDKIKRKSKSNTDSMLQPPAQHSGDSVTKLHRKKKRKHKHERRERNESESINVINGQNNQDPAFLTKAPDPNNTSVEKTDDCTDLLNQESSLRDNQYNGEPKSVTAMSKPNTGKVDKGKLADFIKKENIAHRECHLYTPKDTGDDCQCGHDKKWHDDKKLEKSDSKTWDMKTHTMKCVCNSFGEIKFEGFENETANSQYIRVEPETKHEFLWTIMTKHWKLPIPKLLISITGGAKRFDPTRKHLQNFKRVLMNAATTTDTWIITGGMGTGVMKIVGEAVGDHILTKGTSDKKIVALGIATWGCVANRENLDGEVVPDKKLWPAIYESTDLCNRKDALLDHNHTHFILVDDGSVNKYGVEIEFVAELEKFISNKKINTGFAEKLSVALPMVKIVVEGGVNTMETVWNSVTANIPVLVLKGTGRAADFIAYGYHLRKSKKEEDFHAKLTKKAESLFRWETGENIKEQIQDCVKQLKDIIDEERLINVFDINEADTKNIDRAILDALLKANESNSEAQLTLALAWNRSDIAEEKIITPSNRKEWKEKEDLLYDAMFIALVQNKAHFVPLFLDCGVSFSKFLTIQTLWNLYAYALSESSDNSAQLLGQLIMSNKQSWRAYLCCRQPENFHTGPDLLKSVGKIIVHLLKEESMNLYSAFQNMCNIRFADSLVGLFRQVQACFD